MTMDQFRLDHRVALVTGAGGGIGQAIVLAFADAGADIVGVQRGDLSEVAALVEARGRRFLPLRADLSTLDARGAAGLVESAIAAAGRLDVLVNNAGAIYRAPALDIPEEKWRSVLNVNLTAAFLLAQAAGRHFAAQRQGKVINIASALSFSGGINVAGYAASKHGIAGLTKALANEWAPFGINVNAIAPGYIETAATAELRVDPDRSSRLLERIPAGRWGRPEDLGCAAVFLASSASNYVHGTILAVDGGWLSR